MVTKTAPKFKSRYPLLLPREDDMTPRWARVSELIKAHPNDFEVKPLGNGFRIVHRKATDEMMAKVSKMLTAMNVSLGGVKDILEVDPIQTIPPTLRSLWAGRDFKVAECGVITLVFQSSDKIYQYPFVGVSHETV